MTKKDFELIAEVFRKLLKPYGATSDLRNGLDSEDDYTMRGIELSACRTADTLKTTNPRFDRKRFLAACTVSPMLDYYPNGIPNDLK